MPPLRSLFAAVSALALAACGGGEGGPATATASLDDELADANTVDPLIASVVNDPLMTDPQLTIRSNVNAVRPPDDIRTAMIPGSEIAPATPGPTAAASPTAVERCTECAIADTALTLAALASRAGDRRMRACAPAMGYAAGWSTDLPDALAVPADAQLIEAAGTNRDGCRIRAVTFATNRPAAAIGAWYAARAAAARFAVRSTGGNGGAVSVGRAPDGTRYVLHVRDVGRGSEARLVVDSAG